MKWNWLERRISLLFHRYGELLARSPLPFIIFPLLLTALLTTGFLHAQPITDAIYLFTPTNAPSKMERLAIHEKWPLVDGRYIPGRSVTQAREIQVTVLARDGGNILEKPYSEAVYRLDMFIQKRIKVKYGDELYSYRDLCLRFRNECPGNKHVHIVSDLFAHGLNISFPTIRLGSESGYLGSSLGGVRLLHADNGSEVVASASSWFLIYQLKFFPNNESFVSGLWEKEMERSMREYPVDPYISVTFFHSQTLTDELKRNAETLAPRFVVAFTLLVFFSALCSLSLLEGTLLIDWVLSKPILSILGVVNAGMGILSGVGLLLLFGVPSNDIVAVMPFLVVAVGTDNMFLMVAAVRRTSRAESVEKRMGECMADAAVSILITATTDAFSFGIGTITSIPAVQIFCLYTCFAISITFLYQMTFFAGLLAVFTRLEARGVNSLFLCPTVPEHDKKISSTYQKWFNMGSRPSIASSSVTEQPTNLPATSLFFDKWFAPVLMNPLARGLVIAWYAIYLLISYYGCTQLKEGLEPINLLVQDSYAIPHYRILQDHFWKYGSILQVVVNNAPDMRLPEERAGLLSLAHEMGATVHSVGDDSAQFWLIEMLKYYRDTLEMEVVDSAFYGMLRHYLSARAYPWAEDILWNKTAAEDEVAVSSFRFLIGMRDISSTTEQQEATRVFREVAAAFPSYNVTTFMPLWLFTDQYAIVVPNTIQNIVIALLCMIVIALLLIPEPTCALWVAMACASIDFGVIGFMTIWGVKLDAISMITIIMSIGFSVDYSAHITYGYVVSKQATPSARIQEALSALGWPLFQGAMSTILAVVVLADVPAYMIVTFFKTVFLAISLGLLHGLLFLPVFLSLFVRGWCLSSKVAPMEISQRGNERREWVPSPVLADRIVSGSHNETTSSPKSFKSLSLKSN